MPEHSHILDSAYHLNGSIEIFFTDNRSKNEHIKILFLDDLVKFLEDMRNPFHRTKRSRENNIGFFRNSNRFLNNIMETLNTIALCNYLYLSLNLIFF